MIGQRLLPCALTILGVIHCASADPEVGSIAIPENATTLYDDLEDIGVLQQCEELSESDDVFLIPWSHISEKVLNRLGFKRTQPSTATSSTSHLNIDIPEYTVPYFIFNTSDPLRMPKSQSRLEYAHFLDHSAPFELPQFSCLVDCMLVLPIPSTLDPAHMTQDVLTLSFSGVCPFFEGESPTDRFLLQKRFTECINTGVRQSLTRGKQIY